MKTLCTRINTNPDMDLSVSHIRLSGKKDFVGVRRERILLEKMFQQRNILL
jgi:hypothetical protein